MKRIVSVAAACLFFVACAVYAEAGDWLQFRGPGGSGIAEASDLPTTWSDTENILWKTPLPGCGASSPIVVGDRVYLTCYSGYGLNVDEPGDQKEMINHVLCVSLKDGKILWDRKSRPRLPEQDFAGFIAHHGYASATPVSDGESVYVFFGRSGVWAYTLDGRPLWSIGVGTGTHAWGSGSSPILVDNLLIVNASIESHAIHALDKKTGKQVWQYDGVDLSWSTPLLVEPEGGRRELIVTMKGKIVSLDPKTGKELWTAAAADDYVCPSPVLYKDTVIAGSSRKKMTVAVRIGGEGDVTDSNTVWELNKTPNVPTPLVLDDLVYWLDSQGMIACYEAATGEMIFASRMSGLRRVYPSMVFGDKKIYATACNGEAVVIRPGRGLVELARNKINDDSLFNGTPAIVGNKILMRSDKFLYCIANKPKDPSEKQE